jgi:hypothetical protein
MKLDFLKPFFRRGTITRVFGMAGLLAAGLVSPGGMPAFADGPGAVTATKIDYYFESFIEVEVRAKILKSEEPSLIGGNTTFTQLLEYVGRDTRNLSQSFASAAEVRKWIEKDLCAETHEVTLKPIRNRGVKGDQTLRGRVTALMITVSGTGAKPWTDSLICKPSPKVE